MYVGDHDQHEYLIERASVSWLHASMWWVAQCRCAPPLPTTRCPARCLAGIFSRRGAHRHSLRSALLSLMRPINHNHYVALSTLVLFTSLPNTLLSSR